MIIIPKVVVEKQEDHGVYFLKTSLKKTDESASQVTWHSTSELDSAFTPASVNDCYN